MGLHINSKLKLGDNTRKSIRSITLRAMLLAVLVTQEYVLTGLPQVQLTVILILVYAHFLRYRELIPLVIGYVLLDNLLMGSFSLLYTPTMLIIWPLYAVIARSLRNRPDYVNFILVVIFPFVYGWAFIPASAYVMHLDTWVKVFNYFLADLVAEFTMSVVSVITFLALYQPLKELLLFLFKRNDPNLKNNDMMSL